MPLWWKGKLVHHQHHMQLIGYLNCTGKLFFSRILGSVDLSFSFQKKKSSKVFINARGKKKMICWEKWLKDWDTLASFCACSQEWSQKFQQNSSQNVGRIIDHMRVTLPQNGVNPTSLSLWVFQHFWSFVTKIRNPMLADKFYRGTIFVNWLHFCYITIFQSVDQCLVTFLTKCDQDKKFLSLNPEM